MKKFLAMLLSLVLVLSLFGPAAAALDEDIAPEEPAEAAAVAVEEEPALPEVMETVTDEEPAAEEPAAEEAEIEEIAEEPAEAAEPEAEEPAEAPAEAEAEAELPEEDAPVEETVPEEEAVIEEEPEKALPTEYSKELETVTVTAVAEAGAFDVPVELQVKPLAQWTAAYKEADAALAEEGYEYDGMLAFDIGFVDANGAPVEPAAPAAVSLTLKNAGVVPADAESAAVAHIDDDGVQLVADTADEAEGTVTVDEATVSAEFVVDSFSTFVITWKEDGEEKNATIRWGYLSGDTFQEMDSEELVSLDTTAATVSLDNAYEGYLSMGASYYEDDTVQAGVEITYTMYKTENGWEYEEKVKDAEGNVTSLEKHPLADGSEIRVFYTQPSEGHPHTPTGEDVNIPTPTTTKNVSVDDNGMATITLDILGAEVEEDNSHYANVLIILDATTSMSGAKWTNAKAAMNTLIETLTEGDNATNAGKIDFALVTFGRSATVQQTWTKDNAAFKTTCAGINMVSTSGTNWEAGMRGGLYGVLNTYPEGETATNHDPTYVIFLTDGDPNTYYWSNDDIGQNIPNTRPQQQVTASNIGDASFYGASDTYMRPGYQGNSTTSATRSKDEAKTIAASAALYGIYCGDSGNTPSGESYNRLVDVIQGQDQGGCGRSGQ